jgi:hypothetical protein
MQGVSAELIHDPIPKDSFRSVHTPAYLRELRHDEVVCVCASARARACVRVPLRVRVRVSVSFVYVCPAYT